MLSSMVFRVEYSIFSPRECRSLPSVTAWSTPSITMDKTRAFRDTHCPYLKIKLKKLLLKILLDRFPIPLIFIKYDICLYNNISTYIILRNFLYLCAKSLPIANKLVSFANGYKQMLIVLNWLSVLYSIGIGQNNYTCQNFDQAAVLLESVRKLVIRT